MASEISERVASLETKVDSIQSSIARIERKLDDVLGNHEHRLTKVEANLNLFKKLGTVLWGVVYTILAAFFGWVLKNK